VVVAVVVFWGGCGCGGAEKSIIAQRSGRCPSLPSKLLSLLSFLPFFFLSFLPFPTPLRYY
jgi:hypothetical protein